MKQAKKRFTRMCISNWGGISHTVLEFHEYVNLFSGKSGSGKSTVMDAIQVILYGSFSPSFLNKAADDAKNRRSVLSYLRGAQKDGSANRGNMDFCSHIVLELEDTGTHTSACVGIAFEVGKNDLDLKKYLYFSHAGRIPDHEYLREDKVPFSNREMSAFIAERAKSGDNRGRADINRTYPSKEAYLTTLNDVIFGFIDGSRFATMEKSAIALKMTSGTGQFIRDYMFPKSTEHTIEKISAQLGSYRDIKERIDDLERRIGLLGEVQTKNRALTETRADIIKTEAILNCMEIETLKNKIEVWGNDLAGIERQLSELDARESALREQLGQKNSELVDVKSSLKSSDYGEKKEQLKQVESVISLLASNSSEWRRIVSDLSLWETDEVVTDYVSNPTLLQLDEIRKGKVTGDALEKLKKRLGETKDDIEQELRESDRERRELERELKEKKSVIEDLKNDRKPYDERLKQARTQLERRLKDHCGQAAKVHIFADLFDIREEEWKNAVEGRMARLKRSLITEPQYAHEAAVLFRQMKQCQEIDLINSDAVVKDQPEAKNGSLYEAVETDSRFADACLKRFLGRIMKCRSVEELEQVRDGVTPDCYSYSNYIFRHLREKDYSAAGACIGRKVSKTQLAGLEADAEKLEKRLGERTAHYLHLRASQDFECLKMDTERLLELSEAAKKLDKKLKEKSRLEQAINDLESGEIAGLKARETALEAEIRTAGAQAEAFRKEHLSLTERKGSVEKSVADKREELERRQAGYVPNSQIEEVVRQALSSCSESSYRNQKLREIEELKSREQEDVEQLAKARQRFNLEYPTVGFSGLEKDNDCYDELLARYQKDYVPEYQEEFEKQCNQVYKSLRENVIATIHGEIKAAYRHAREINRMLGETSFSDSVYQIEIQPATDENRQFYEMLTAKELDSKTNYQDDVEGQLSFGEDTFLQKYGPKIELLTEKFMPVKSGEEHQIAKRRQEMERYADYRNYLSFSMYERVVDESGNERRNYVDEMAGRDSGGEGQNPKYVALLAGFAMLYMQQSNRDSRIKLVLLDEAFSKMDQERSEVCLRYARKLELQLIVCVPDERLQSLIRNVDSVYGFRRYQNQISMMHIDKGNYLELLEGDDEQE